MHQYSRKMFVIIWSNVNDCSCGIENIQECVCNHIAKFVLIIVLYWEYSRTCLIMSKRNQRSYK